jgi:hypothetical protein
VVSATGDGCIYEDGEYIEVWLSANPDNSSFNYLGGQTIFSIENDTGANQACGVGQFNSFAFQYMQAVTGNTTYTYYLKAHKGSAAARAFVTFSPVLVTYYPIRY